MAGKRIGVLALQGAFSKHCEMLRRLGVEALEVRTGGCLDLCDGLIIPGGESTSMLSISEMNLRSFKKPIFGTCAGMILMTRFGFLDLSIKRNAYGRQINSFSKELILYLDQPCKMDAIFIRAPKIEAILSDEVKVLADIPVIVRQGNYLATTFHPELTENAAVHNYFLKMCDKL